MLTNIKKIRLLKEDIRRLLKRYHERRIDIGDLVDEADEMESQIYVGNEEWKDFLPGTLEAVYSEILAQLSMAYYEHVLPEDVPMILEYLDAKEGELKTAKKKWDKYWSKVGEIKRDH